MQKEFVNESCCECRDRRHDDRDVSTGQLRADARDDLEGYLAAHRMRTQDPKVKSANLK